jgi:hypothetical protein
MPPVNQPVSPARLQSLKVALLFAVVHYVVLLGVSGLIFLAGHIPPKAVNLDAVITGMVAVETALVAPRKCLLWLWPWETTPSGFGLALTVINSLVWGLVLSTIRLWWQRAIR